MATIGNTNLTLLDLSKRLEDKKIARIVEIMTQTNPIVRDMITREANEMTGHTSTQRTGLPTAVWRRLNEGVAQSKSTTQQIRDSIGILESRSQVDKDLAMLNGNANEFRASEDRAFFEAFAQTIATTLFYGDTSVNSERFMGLAPRYDTISTTKTNIGYNIINAGGTESVNASAWLVTWDENICHGIFPKGSQVGFLHEDLGQQTVLDASSNAYEALVSRYQWKLGLTLRDWRGVARLANIPVAGLTADAATGVDLINQLVLLLNKVNRFVRTGKKVLYVSTTVKNYLDLQAINKTVLALQMRQFAGEEVTHFRGIPIFECDALLETESTIS